MHYIPGGGICQWGKRESRHFSANSFGAVKTQVANIANHHTPDLVAAGNGINQTVTANASGEILIDGLTPGVYTVTKTSEDGLVEGMKFHRYGTSLWAAQREMSEAKEKP